MYVPQLDGPISFSNALPQPPAASVVGGGGGERENTVSRSQDSEVLGYGEKPTMLQSTLGHADLGN